MIAHQLKDHGAMDEAFNFPGEAALLMVADLHPGNATANRQLPVAQKQRQVEYLTGGFCLDASAASRTMLPRLLLPILYAGSSEGSAKYATGIASTNAPSLGTLARQASLESPFWPVQMESDKCIVETKSARVNLLAPLEIPQSTGGGIQMAITRRLNYRSAGRR